MFRYPQVDSPLDLIKNAYKIRSFFEFSQYQNQGINQSNANNKEAKIDLNNKKINVNNKNKISKMTKKEKEVYDFDKKDINQNFKYFKINLFLEQGNLNKNEFLYDTKQSFS